MSDINVIAIIITNIISIGGLLLGFLNYTARKKVDNSQMRSEDASALESLNRAVNLANERAMRAEARADDEEANRKLVEEKVEQLKKEIEGLHHYRMIFDVQLGRNPSIESASIFPAPAGDRRIRDIPYDGADKRKSFSNGTNQTE